MIPNVLQSGLPYFKFLKKESQEHKDGEVAHTDFARMQREALENYLIGLIRAVVKPHIALHVHPSLTQFWQMFHPTANRLAGFLEIGALSIALAQTGGSQAKAGYLRIEASGNKGGGFGRKSSGWLEKKAHRWCAVRESYLVVQDQPGEVRTKFRGLFYIH
jgi:phospholipase D1/2